MTQLSEALSAAGTDRVPSPQSTATTTPVATAHCDDECRHELVTDRAVMRQRVVFDSLHDNLAREIIQT